MLGAEELTEALYHSINSGGNVKAVRQLLEQGANPTARVQCGATILGRAVQLGDRDVIYTLVRRITSARDADCRAFDVDTVDRFGRTPLHYACEKGHEDVICLLLGTGCSLDLRDDEGIAPIHLATSQGKEAAVLALLRAGCCVNLRTGETYEKVTSLHIAVSRGMNYIAEHLLRYGAKTEIPDYKDQTPLFLAVSRNAHDCAAMLIAHGANVNTEQLSGYTPLTEAVAYGDAKMVSLLVEGGAMPRPDDHLLHQALNQGSEEVASILIESGCCLLGHTNRVGDTALHLACQKGLRRAVELLLQFGAPPNQGNDHTGAVPVMSAVSSLTDLPVFASILSLLVAAGADVDRPTHDPGSPPDTPLRRAIYSRKPDFAKLLVVHGATFHSQRLRDPRVIYFIGMTFGVPFLRSLLVENVLSLRTYPLADCLRPFESPTGVARTPEETQQCAKLASLVQFHWQNGPNLKRMCRETVRNCLGSTYLFAKVNALPIPETLKDFLKLCDGSFLI